MCYGELKFKGTFGFASVENGGVSGVWPEALSFWEPKSLASVLVSVTTSGVSCFEV